MMPKKSFMELFHEKYEAYCKKNPPVSSLKSQLDLAEEVLRLVLNGNDSAAIEDAVRTARDEIDRLYVPHRCMKSAQQQKDGDQEFLIQVVCCAALAVEPGITSEKIYARIG